MINWWNDIRHLKRWRERIVADVGARHLHFVFGYDHGEDTPANDAAWIERTAALIRGGKAMGARGFWFWAWRDIRAGDRSYKGLGTHWETRRLDGKRIPAYAALIESIHGDAGRKSRHRKPRVRPRRTESSRSRLRRWSFRVRMGP